MDSEYFHLYQVFASPYQFIANALRAEYVILPLINERVAEPVT